MAYVKKIWKDYPDTTTPILASDMNNIENGIEAVDTALENLNNIEDGLETVTNNVNNGWISLTGTFTYSSADSPTFVMTTSVDLTGIVGLGMRIKLTQTTTQYFIVTAITNDSITMYGGTDYTLTNAPISDAFYSIVKAPYGFPMDPNKWSITITPTGGTQATPNTSNFYNLGSNNIILPIGEWDISYLLRTRINNGDTSTDRILYGYLSNSSSSLSSQSVVVFNGMVGIYYFDVLSSGIIKGIVITTKTTKYLIFRATNIAPTGSSIDVFGDGYIKATCVYL